MWRDWLAVAERIALALERIADAQEMRAKPDPLLEKLSHMEWVPATAEDRAQLMESMDGHERNG